MQEKYPEEQIRKICGLTEEQLEDIKLEEQQVF